MTLLPFTRPCTTFSLPHIAWVVQFLLHIRFVFCNAHMCTPVVVFGLWVYTRGGEDAHLKQDAESLRRALDSNA